MTIFFWNHLKLRSNHGFHEAVFSLCVLVITDNSWSLTAMTRHHFCSETAGKAPPRSRCSPAPTFSGWFSSKGVCNLGNVCDLLSSGVWWKKQCGWWEHFGNVKIWRPLWWEGLQGLMREICFKVYFIKNILK
jgi:hypothetical protein